MGKVGSFYVKSAFSNFCCRRGEFRCVRTNITGTEEGLVKEEQQTSHVDTAMLSPFVVKVWESAVIFINDFTITTLVLVWVR